MKQGSQVMVMIFHRTVLLCRMSDFTIKVENREKMCRILPISSSFTEHLCPDLKPAADVAADLGAVPGAGPD